MENCQQFGWEAGRNGIGSRRDFCFDNLGANIQNGLRFGPGDDLTVSTQGSTLARPYTYQLVHHCPQRRPTSEWIKSVTHPLGLAGFALLVFLLLLTRRRPDTQPTWLKIMFAIMAFVALLGGI